MKMLKIPIRPNYPSVPWWKLGLAFSAMLFIVQPASAENEAAPTPQEVEFFEAKIRPLLVENCHDCHGATTQWAGLRLDTRDGMQKGGDRGPVLVRGSADTSELIRRVFTEDESTRMPPPDSGKQLTSQQIQALRGWIDRGAVWPVSDEPTISTADAAKDHWAFQPIERPPLPQIGDAKWVQAPIDRFVLRKLEENGLRPSPPADRRTLIRRATYGLTGLPPTPEEVDAFVADPSPDAYAQLIDRLLASPAYGEQWGRHWLDVARYSDTKGYVYGREERFFVHSSIYRDWVVKAFNDDLPYDRFLLLQLAADQAAPEDPSAAAALGFITLGRRFLGVQPDIIDDRIDVVTRGTMGLTVACARCHDHKFDPIPTADYYSLYGVFQNCFEITVALPTQGKGESSSELTLFEVELHKRKTALSTKMAERRAEFSDLARERIDEYLMAQFELEKYPELAFSQILTKADLLPATVRRWQRYLNVAVKNDHPAFVPWAVLARVPEEEFAAEAAQALASVDLSPSKTNPKVAAAFATPPQSPRELVDRYVQLFQEVDQKWKQLSAKAKTENLPPPTQLSDPADEQLRQVLYEETSPCVVPDLPIVNIEFYFDTGTCVELWKLQSAVDQWILTNPTAVPHAVVLQDKKQVVNPRIFRRGNPENLGDEVSLRFLQVLSRPQQEPFSRGSGRYEMAQAIISPENPLTPRVWVNRVWAHHFGEGIVRTLSDFGTRAGPPSHPELLDWLAHEFVAQGWSTKDLHRHMMLSATYQQSSRGPADGYAAMAEIDPENRLLWRMNPHRLSFEELRDTYLAVAGDLDKRMGGKGSDLFNSSADGLRRTLYAVIDRQLLPSVFNAFDFANPDLHTPQRSETTTPQQGLFVLNHVFVADRARSLAADTRAKAPADAKRRVSELYRQILQRDPTPDQLEAALHFIQMSIAEPVDTVRLTAANTWSYGCGEIEPHSETLLGFQPLPHFTGSAWQGSAAWPDTDLGWAQITAEGGHPGNDLRHAIVRRWTAPAAGTYQIVSTIKHSVATGDGIRCWILSSRGGMLQKAIVHNSENLLNVEAIELEAGDTVDFVVDIYEVLNSDQHLWVPEISLKSASSAEAAVMPNAWHGERDFTASSHQQLDPWEQLAQILLISNEVLFVD